MKNAFKVLCFTLAVIIVVTSAFLIYFKWDKSQFEYVDGTEKGTVMITGYKDESKDVTIPSKLRGKKVTQIDTSAFEESEITSIEIGDNVGISQATLISHCSIKIGNNVKIGGGGCVFTSDFHSLDPIIRAGGEDQANKKCAPVVLCDNVFIGAHSIILKGVTIGENSIVGAGSVVTKSIPANQMWGGNPAKFIRNL